MHNIVSFVHGNPRIAGAAAYSAMGKLLSNGIDAGVHEFPDSYEVWTNISGIGYKIKEVHRFLNGHE